MRKKKIRRSTYEEFISGYGKSVVQIQPSIAKSRIVSRNFNTNEFFVTKRENSNYESSFSNQPTNNYFNDSYNEHQSFGMQSDGYQMVQPFSDENISVEQEYNFNVINPNENTTFIAEQSLPAAEATPIESVVPIEPAQLDTSTQEGIRQSAPPQQAPLKHSPTDDDITADLEAILKGEKVFDPVTKQTVSKNAATPLPTPSPNVNNQPAPLPTTNEHAIFDRIAQSMQYANAYDLGSLDLDKRLSDFDKIEDLDKQLEKNLKDKKSNSESRNEGANFATAANFIEDLDEIKRNSSSGNKTINSFQQQVDITTTAEWPARPVNLRPYTLAEKRTEFGTFDFEPDPTTSNGDGIKILGDWVKDNIQPVDIPQLEGIIRGMYPNGTRIAQNRGIIEFHKKGAQQLKNLWKAWADAGLLGLVLTFSAGFVPRYVRSKVVQPNRSLSNHSWGTAFDINVQWNHRGDVPALKGTLGSTRQLVDIANEYGFFWGGHFRGDAIDGMHFELGKSI